MNKTNINMNSMRNILSLLTLVLCNIALAQTNFLDNSTWADGNNSALGFIKYGTNSENLLELGIGPHSTNQVVLWKAIPDGTGGSDGGWNTDYYNIDHTKKYRFTTWIKKTGSNDGNTLFGFYCKDSGTNNVGLKLDGSSNVNPYFLWGDLPQLDKWYLLVGYVHGSASTTTISEGGIYDPSTDTKVAGLVDFKFSTAATRMTHRNYLYADSNINDRQYFYDPTIYEVNLQMPTRQELYSEPSNTINSVYSSDFSLRINAGGPELTHNGEVYIADQNNIGGGTYVNANAQMPALYQSERSGALQYFSYNIPLANGEYTVDLHFAELYWGATGGGTGGIGKRVFDVNLEGNLILDNYDITADVGAETPVVKTFNATVTDGVLNIDFSSLASVGGVNQAKVSAIEVSGISTTSGNSPWVDSNSNLSYMLGNVGIGTSDPGTSKLAVNGTVHTKEVHVNETNWPDYVFKENYKLPTLEEVEKHIQEKGHLINIPSAVEVDANGIELGKMNKLLLEKIEELTLYIIKNEERINLIEN